ncbi:hypothetical protein GYMLUDRAFT_255417, partial [Collybiopsis luxurians FD-317 M1]
MPIALIVGASHSLRLALAKNLHNRGEGEYKGEDLPEGINLMPNIDLTREDAEARIVSYLKGDFGLGSGSGTGGEEGKKQLDLVIVNAGVFKADTLAEPNFDNVVEMFKVVSITPLMIASHLTNANLLTLPSKFVIISFEGSIALQMRHDGAGNYGHHPGFMMGFDQFYESGAVEPSKAAETTIDFILNELPHDLTVIPFQKIHKDMGEAERVLVPIMGSAVVYREDAEVINNNDL